MKFLIENWPVCLALLALGSAVTAYAVQFLRLPKAEQLKNLKTWLLWAVTQAEKELGDGTGKLKLAMVYDMFVAKFPEMALVLSNERFSGLVDEALEEMKKMLETNKAAAKIVSP